MNGFFYAFQSLFIHLINGILYSIKNAKWETGPQKQNKLLMIN